MNRVERFGFGCGIAFLWIGCGMLSAGFYLPYQCYRATLYGSLLQSDQDQERQRMDIRRNLRVISALGPLGLAGVLLETGAERGFSYEGCEWPPVKAEAQ